jgi:hypothetical protein
VATSAGWRLAANWFLPYDEVLEGSRLRSDVDYFGSWPCERGQGALPFLFDKNGRAAALARQAPPVPIISVIYRFVRPFWRVFDATISYRELAYYLFGGLWMLAVWSFFGGAIVRMAAVFLGREERIGLREAFIHARRKLGSHIAAPLLPLIGVVLLATPLIALGWCMRTDVGVFLSGLLWLPVLIGTLFMAILLLGLLFGWPLMWGTIDSEGSDSFDAISRTYAYSFQCPLQYLFYSIVAVLFGLLGWLLVWGVSESVISLGYWGTAWGAGPARVAAIEAANHAIAEGPAGQGTLWTIGAALIGLLVGIVRTFAGAFAYSYFWCAAAGVYLLLRSDTDNTELDDIFMEQDADTTYGLPPLKNDEAGVPGVADESVEENSSSSE